ncbi:MAG: prepilin-type N-terminal cleavage/methylation domain-containing protein [Armatimonadetes bacterium]|nr:prepilin-type N-terminal cleavage/methylation domain-containing protein [Armatimonadota bacterium]
MKNNKNGFTLAELLVAAALFMLLGGALLTVVSMALRSWRDADVRVNNQQNVRLIQDAIVSELRQAIPDSDPGGLNPPTGYLSVTPAISPTGVIFPNTNTPLGNYVEFTEPNPAVYDPSSVGFNPATPSNYRRIKYYLQSGYLKRDSTEYDSNGTPLNQKTTNIAQINTGTITLEVARLGTKLYQVKFTVQQGNQVFMLVQKVFVPAE